MAQRRILVGASVFLLLILGMPGFLLAQPSVDDAIRVSRQGLMFNARSLGMGNAYSTIGYDFSALRMNPATMGMADGASYTMSVNTNGSLYSSTFFGTQANYTTTNTTLSQAGFTIPFKLDSLRRATIALGYTQDKDFNKGGIYEGFNEGTKSFVSRLAESPNDVARTLGLIFPTYDQSGRYLGDQTILNGSFTESGNVLDGGEMLHFSGGVALEAVTNVFFGVSGSYNMGSYQSDGEFTANDDMNMYADSLRTSPTDPRTAGFIDASYRDIRNTEYKGWDVRFGVVYRLWNFIGVSASFKVPFEHTISETRYLSGTATYSSGSVLEVEESPITQKYKIKPPYEATVGGMVNLWILTGTAEATYVDYTQMEVSGGPDVPERSSINKSIKEKFTRVLNLNAGAEFRLPFTGLSARAGAMYRPSPYKDDPGRYDQKFVTLGLGINSADKLFFDIGYLYGWWDQQKSDGQTAVEPTTNQTIAYHNLLLSMKFVF